MIKLMNIIKSLLNRSSLFFCSRSSSANLETIMLNWIFLLMISSCPKYSIRRNQKKCNQPKKSWKSSNLMPMINRHSITVNQITMKIFRSPSNSTRCNL